MANPLISGNTVNIPVGGGNLSLNLANGTVSLSNGSASVEGNISDANLKLSVGALSVSFSANGSDSVSFSTGLVTSTLNFTPIAGGAEVTGASLTAGGSLVGVGANATISISDTSGSWVGTVSGGTTTGISFIDNLTHFSDSFNPTVQDPCSIVPLGFGTMCSRLESSAASGSINLQEQQQLQETDLVDPTSFANDTLLAKADSAGIAYDTANGFYGSTSITGITGLTGITGITGITPGGGEPAIAHGGYAAAVARSNKIAGDSIAALSSLDSKIAPLAAATTKSLAAGNLAYAVAKATYGTNQSYYAVASLDGETLVGNKGAIVSINANLTGSVYSKTASGAGQQYEVFDSSGEATSEAISGTGESVTMQNGVVNLAASSSATVVGNGNSVTVGNSSSLAVGTSQDLVYLGQNDTFSAGTGQFDLFAPNNTTETIIGGLTVLATPVPGVSSAVTTKDTFNVTGNYAVIAADTSKITLNGSGNYISIDNGTAGGDTVYANNSHITFNGSAAALATDTVVGTGNTVTKNTPHPRVISNNSSVAGESLLQAMATYAPQASAETQHTWYLQRSDGATLAASSYIH